MSTRFVADNILLGKNSNASSNQPSPKPATPENTFSISSSVVADNVAYVSASLYDAPLTNASSDAPPNEDTNNKVLLRA